MRVRVQETVMRLLPRLGPTAFPLFLLVFLLAALAGAGGASCTEPKGTGEAADPKPATGESPGTRRAEATFAGGCFWCMEAPFDELDGVFSTTSGYSGGHKENPTYKEVSAGGTGHAEVVRIVYDPDKVGYQELLRIFWRNIDPTDSGGQFCDRGSQYRSGIFVHDETQRRLALESKSELEGSGQIGSPIVTEIVEADTFYPAEDYHQDYYRKNPVRYSFYRRGCGRDARLREVWGEEAGAGH